MFLDELISEFDRGLRSMTGVSRMSRPLPVPQESTAEPVELSPAERAHAAGLMRVNHVGEVCAQALYQARYPIAVFAGCV
jgi:3-demethoxyubiquinol 3-hydroxylase